MFRKLVTVTCVHSEILSSFLTSLGELCNCMPSTAIKFSAVNPSYFCYCLLCMFLNTCLFPLLDGLYHQTALRSTTSSTNVCHRDTRHPACPGHFLVFNPNISVWAGFFKCVALVISFIIRPYCYRCNIGLLYLLQNYNTYSKSQTVKIIVIHTV